MYNPTIGRWMTRDAIGEEGGENLYAYCDDDPINGSDPTGLADTSIQPPPPSTETPDWEGVRLQEQYNFELSQVNLASYISAPYVGLSSLPTASAGTGTGGSSASPLIIGLGVGASRGLMG